MAVVGDGGGGEEGLFVDGDRFGGADYGLAGTGGEGALAVSVIEVLGKREVVVASCWEGPTLLPHKRRGLQRLRGTSC